MEHPEPVLYVGASTGPGRPVVVGADRIAAFASALNPGALTPDARQPAGSSSAPTSTVAPPTLVVALALDSPGGPVDLIAPLMAGGVVGGVVHGDQQLTVHRPVRVGDALVFTSVVETVRRLPGSTMTAIATAVASADAAVADLRATFVLTDPAEPA